MILACHNISKAFGDQVIVKSGSFHIEDREKAALIGLNGAGKSTILKMIVRELDTDGGEIILQKAVEVEEGDTPEILQRRVMEQAEWIILPRAVEIVSEKIVNA